MNELHKTAIYVAAAAVLCATAMAVSSPGGGKTPPVFTGQGEPFFPQFTSIDAATALEVYDFDAEAGETKAFKVELQNGVWRIPSKDDYPADAEKKLGQVAAALVGLERQAFRTNREEDWKDCGVVDPQADISKPKEGRGRRVTLRDKDGKPLADLILGKTPEEAPGKRFVRVPDDKRVYMVDLDLTVSTEFSDWIETDLLKLDIASVTTITHEAYTVDEAQLRRGRLYVDKQDTVVLGQSSWNKWTLEGTPEGKQVKMETVDKLTGMLGQLKIKDVHPFVGEEMAAAGFFWIPSEKKVYSNEGELLVDSKNGVRYTLRFGEAAPTPQGETGIRRYAIVDVTAHYPALAKPEDEAARKEADELAKRLQARFKDWYYVISAESYEALKPTREALLEDIPPPGAEDGGEEGHDDHDGHDHGEMPDLDQDGDGKADDESFFAPPPGGDGTAAETPPAETAPVDSPAQGQAPQAPGSTPPQEQEQEQAPPQQPAPPVETPPQQQEPAPQEPAPPAEVAPVDSPSQGQAPAETPPGDVAPVGSPG